ncbi:MAG: cyclic nucleotide-binding domain-containing protein [Deltaproteobacteria bacterium]|nr:cyclic nucleotide-binding domain-containing protein [Deltaproteobacteria bacterium]
MSALEATTLDRAKDAARAELEGKIDEAIAAVADVVWTVPEDLEALRTAARLTAKKGRDEGPRALVAVAGALLDRGYPLAALGALKDVLDLAPNRTDAGLEAPIKAALEKLHSRVAGRAAGRVHVPRPPLPMAISSSESEPLATILAALPTDLNTNEIGAEAGPLPPFSEVSSGCFLDLASTMAHRRLGDGEVLVSEGDAGSSLFIVVHGSVEVSRTIRDAPVVLARLGPGAILGEMSLVASPRRGATVKAIEPTEIFEIDRPHVEHVAAVHPAFTDELVRFARRRMVGNLLATSPLFKGLDESAKMEVLKAFTSRVVGLGELIIGEGSEPVGLFVVASGEVEISKTEPGGDRIVLAHLREGEVFGEIALVEGSKTTASAVATQRTVLLGLGASAFQKIREAHPKVREYLEALTSDRKSETDRVMGEGEVLDADDLILV